jgi:very-short-patch-repair endonuclease
MVKLRGREEYPFYFGAKVELLKIAWKLRNSMTPAEKILWGKLRNKQVLGYRFRRQHPIKDFIVDFFCYDAMLVIEVDGEVHDQGKQIERDIERTNILRKLGIKELRFKNEEVINQLDQVIEKIEVKLQN